MLNLANHPNALTPQSIARLFAAGSIVALAPAVPDAPKSGSARFKVKTEAEQERTRQRCRAAGKTGGAPLSSVTPDKLREAVKLRAGGYSMRSIEDRLGVGQSSLRYHFYSRNGGFSRAMLAAIGK